MNPAGRPRLKPKTHRVNHPIFVPFREGALGTASQQLHRVGFEVVTRKEAGSGIIPHNRQLLARLTCGPPS
jgi:hypothetical protein